MIKPNIPQRLIMILSAAYLISTSNPVLSINWGSSYSRPKIAAPVFPHALLTLAGIGLIIFAFQNASKKFIWSSLTAAALIATALIIIGRI